MRLSMVLYEMKFGPCILMTPGSWFLLIIQWILLAIVRCTVQSVVWMAALSGLSASPSKKKKTWWLYRWTMHAKKKTKIIRLDISKKLFRWLLAVASAIILFQLFGIYWMNNSFDDITVEVAFVVIVFQLSRIYKLNYSVGNPICNNFEISFFKTIYWTKKEND